MLERLVTAPAGAVFSFERQEAWLDLFTTIRLNSKVNKRVPPCTNHHVLGSHTWFVKPQKHSPAHWGCHLQACITKSKFLKHTDSYLNPWNLHIFCSLSVVSFYPNEPLKNVYTTLSDGLHVPELCDILISILGRGACLQFINGAGLFCTS